MTPSSKVEADTIERLIERLEKATGGHDPALALDFFYHVEADDRYREMIDGARDRVASGELKEADLFGWRVLDESQSARAILSGSLDAALALVERVLPGWGYFIRRDEDGCNAGLLHPVYNRVTPGCGQHPTSQAIALLIAALKAIAQTDGTQGETTP